MRPIARPRLTGTVPAIDVNTPNVLRFRTFSKAYGMAGVRVGAVFGPEDAVGPSTRCATISASAAWRRQARIAALKDQAWLRHVDRARSPNRVAAIATGGARQRPASPSLRHKFRCHRLRPRRRVCQDGPRRADRAGHFRAQTAAPVLDRCIRVSCGTDARHGAVCRRAARSGRRMQKSSKTQKPPGLSPSRLWSVPFPFPGSRLPRLAVCPALVSFARFVRVFFSSL